jgi:hypothetical protein
MDDLKIRENIEVLVVFFLAGLRWGAAGGGGNSQMRPLGCPSGDLSVKNDGNN